MRKVSNEFIDLSKKVKIQDLKLTINEGELTVQEVHLMPVNIFNSIPINILRARKQVIAKELTYGFEGQLFKTIMQQIEITVKNASEVKGKYVDFQYGIQVNNKFEYVNMGEYYIKDVEDDKNKEELVVTGYDKMLNFMKPFKQSELQLTYPCKMSQLVNRMGEVCGVEIYSADFFNFDLIVDEDFFTAQQVTYRDVLEKVAQTTLTTIFIKENKLYLCKIGDSVQTLDTSFLSNLVVGEKFGPVNALVLGRGSVEDNIESVNQDSINTNGRCEIRFDENEFVDSKREEVIDLMLQQIDGLEYYALEASNLGLLWLEPCDVIIAKDREDNPYKSIYLKANVTINTGIKGEMEAEIPDTTTTEYKVTTKEEKKTLKVERLAKKNEGLIQDVIEQQSETGEKLSKVEQTVDGISQKVSKVEEQVETAEEKADAAQETADQVNNDLTTKYYTKTETNSQINQKSEEITSTVGKTYSTKTETTNAKQEAINTANTNTDNKLKNYSTTEQMNSAITQKADEISLEVSKKVGEDELSTKIQQDYESVRIAWNKISEFIQFINAQLQIKDNSKKLLMALDKLGMHFYKSTGTELGDIGIQDSDVISFAVMNGQGSMAWGIKYTHDGTTDFYPVFSFNGKMVADGSSENGGYGFDGYFDFEAPVRLFENPIYFTDENGASMQCDILGNLFLSALSSITIYDNYGLDAFSMNFDNKSLNLFGLLNVGANTEGGYTFDFNGNSIMNAENMAWTDTIEYLSSGDNYLFVSNKDGTYFSLWTDSSDKKLKKNIKSTKSRALDKIKQIKHKEFNWKSNGEHQEIGYIAQEMQKIDPTFVRVAKYKTRDGQEKEDWQINTLSVLASVTKAMQEQDEEIENLKKKDEEKDILIQSLLERIERLEGRQ